MASQPEDTLRDGNLKSTIWKNQGDKGAFFSVTLTRSYQDDADNWHETDSFSGTQLLRIAHLAGRAYDRVTELRQQERSNDARMAS